MKLFKKKESAKKQSVKYYIPEKHKKKFYQLYSNDLRVPFQKHALWVFIFSIITEADRIKGYRVNCENIVMPYIEEI